MTCPAVVSRGPKHMDDTAREALIRELVEEHHPRGGFVPCLLTVRQFLGNPRASDAGTVFYRPADGRQLGLLGGSKMTSG